jgi:hypothetical protein
MLSEPAGAPDEPSRSAESIRTKWMISLHRGQGWVGAVNNKADVWRSSIEGSVAFQAVEASNTVAYASTPRTWTRSTGRSR